MNEPRTPPHSIEAEQSVLGGILIDNRAFDRAAEIVREGDFYEARHRIIWRAMAGLIERGKPADVVTVDEAIKSSEDRDRTGGLAYLAALTGNTPSSHNIRRYAEIVRERAQLRAVQTLAAELHDLAANPGGRSAGEVISAAEEKLLAVLDRGAREYVSLKDAMTSAMEHVDAAYHRGGGLSGVASGYKELDRMTGGLEAGDLVIIAGRPSMGKTALALNIAEHVAASVGPVAFFSLEMSKDQLGMRVLAGGARLPMSNLRAGKVTDEGWARISEAVSRRHALPILIDDTPAVSCAHVRARARRIQRERGGLSLIVVDYLQLMRADGSNRDRNREQEVSSLSRGLKAIAKELNVPVLCLSQLNRAPEGRTDKRPTLADLRDSGSIEQDADIVMFIYRDEVYNPDSWSKGTAEILFRKQRNGPLGEVFLNYLGPLMRFEDCAEPPQRPVAEPARRSRGFSHAVASAGD